MDEKPSETVTAYVPPRIKRKLEARAARERRTVSAQVWIILEEALRDEPDEQEMKRAS